MRLFSSEELQIADSFFIRTEPLQPKKIDFNNPYFTQPKTANKEHILNVCEELRGITAEHLYVHVPFCPTHCLYCHYPTITNQHSPENQTKFIQQVESEWEQYQNIGVEFSGLKTIHIGGGTPNCLSSENLDYLTNRLNTTFAPTVEFAVELYPSPDDLTEEKFEILAKNGVNRVSIGIQTFNYAVNERNRRIKQKPEDLIRAIKLAKQFFNNVSIDLLYGQKDQTLDVLESDCEIALDLELNSVYLYQTRELIGKKLLELQKALNIFLSFFATRGYEIVSFDQVIKKRNSDGFCAHRSGRSLSENLLAVGPGAVSEMGEFIFKTVDPIQYAIKPRIDYQSVVKRSDRTRKLEYLNRALRHYNIPGINGALLTDYRNRFGDISPLNEFHNEITSLKENKLILIDEDRIEITDLGMLFTQSINNYLLGHYK
jgi:coproporphyrinogen III oxidase-like Fe-S oxidoreductase